METDLAIWVTKVVEVDSEWRVTLRTYKNGTYLSFLLMQSTNVWKGSPGETLTKRSSRSRLDAFRPWYRYIAVGEKLEETEEAEKSA